MKRGQHIRALLWLIGLAGAALAQQPLDLNHAREADLDGLTGLGPAMTARILHARTQAPFSNWGDFIARVPGIGQRSARKLSAQGLLIDGLPYTAHAQEPTDNPPTAPPIDR